MSIPLAGIEMNALQNHGLQNHASQSHAFQNYDALPLGIVVINSDYEILFWNRYLENWTDWRLEHLQGTDARLRMPALARADYRVRMEDTFRSGVPAVFSPQLHAPLLEVDPPSEVAAGQGRVLATSVTAISDPSGKGFLAVISIQDITDLTRRLRQIQVTATKLQQELKRRQELEAELCRSKEAAERANQAKTNFLAIMSHEMRTPLHAILGAADLLSASELHPGQRLHVDMFQRAGNNLLALINDILDLTKIESGHFEFEAVELNLWEIVTECVRLIGPGMAAKGLELTSTVDPRLQGKLLGDPARIRQVLLNLLGNALKFTEEGEIAVFVGPAGSSNSGSVEIVISDSGMGIEPQQIRAIFDDFTQADSSNTRKHGGSGLGLSIARRLVERMGGKIAVLSEPSKGTTFSFTLNLQPVEGSQPVSAELPSMAYGNKKALPEPSETAPLRILVAEDSEDNQLLLAAFLAQTRYELCFANDGAAAVGMFEVEPFDVVLMDVQMPVMDGLEATRNIRDVERKRGRGRVPIVAITASALAHDREATAQAGCDIHLSKPLSQERILSCLSQFGGDSFEPPSEALAGVGSPIMVTVPAALMDVVGPYLESRANELSELDTLLTAGEFDRIRQIGHKLKGTGGGYGFQELTEIGARLERGAIERSSGSLREQLTQLSDYLTRVRVAQPEMSRIG